ncbi:hypothetical protein PMIN07_004948 [Paraphaeosphaeria minitans]
MVVLIFDVAIQCVECDGVVVCFPHRYIDAVFARDLDSIRHNYYNYYYYYNYNYYYHYYNYNHLNAYQTNEMAPRSAALAGLYFHSHRNSRGRRSSHFYMLSNQDMPLLARIFHGTQAPEIQERIKTLPRHLRASGFHSSPSPSTGRVQPGYLCDVHRKLKKGLCYEVMSMVEHEISRIGSFTYSVIVGGELEASEEMRVRWLEPVPHMYVPGFEPHEGAPVGREPIVPGVVDRKGIFVALWGYEASQCPACMLSRIGADSKVLFALLAGTVARLGKRTRGRGKNLKSRRVRFQKEWLEAHEDGQRLVDYAFDLGDRMRDIKRNQRRPAYEERPRGMQAREAYDFRVGTSGRRSMNRSDRAVSHDAADATGFRERVIDIDISEPYAPQHSHRGSYGPERPVSYTAAGAVGRRGSVIDIDISESYAPQYQQASRCSIHNVNPPTDQTTAIGVDAFRPGCWRLRNNIPCSKENVVSGEDARGTDRQSTGTVSVGVDISEPFIPAPRLPSIYRQHCEPDADEPAILASMQPRTTSPVETPVRIMSRRSGMVFARSTSCEHYPSIASSFASNVSLSDLRAPSVDPSLVPSPLRISSRLLPPIAERGPDRVPRPHPLSIYGTAHGSTTVAAGRYADVSPPSTPKSDGRVQGHYDVSPPSTPEFDEFEGSLLGRR